MTELPDNILHLPQYQVLGCKSTDDEMHFQVDGPDPIACEECGVQGEFVRFGKRDVPYRDLPIHGKRVTLWVVRRRYTCRACKTTFRPQLPEMVDGFRMTLRLHEYVEKESFNHPYTFVAAQTGLDEKTVRDIFNARAEFLGRWHRFETPRILGIDELYLSKKGARGRQGLSPNQRSTTRGQQDHGASGQSTRSRTEVRELPAGIRQ
ncbi:hypothetical protein FIV02_20530 [Pseudomonas sp. THAF187a]|nr:hypothetical protein FIV02_20530 [Pseudomonas sp. THAF187a]QFT44148.1 hypothetical protein FIU98_20515 [Pseudomonas sp. THAF42]